MLITLTKIYEFLFATKPLPLLIFLRHAYLVKHFRLSASRNRDFNDSLKRFAAFDILREDVKS